MRLNWLKEYAICARCKDQMKELAAPSEAMMRQHAKGFPNEPVSPHEEICDSSAELVRNWGEL